MNDAINTPAPQPSPRDDLLRGAREVLPILAATTPFGLVFGTIAAHHGLSLGNSLFMSAAVFAGASQFVALEFWVHPLPVIAILLSVMAVNLRLLLYSAAMARRIRHWPPLAAYLGLGIITDPIVAAAELKGGPRLSAHYYFGMAVPLYLNWTLMTGIGFVSGSLIEEPQAIGLDFVVTAYFMYMLIGFRKRPNAVAVVLASAAASAVTYVTVGSPWHFAVGAAAGISVAIALFRPNGALA